MDIRSFAREFINRPSARTAERKRAIRDALYKLTGQRLQKGCNTCYIEALFKILKLTSMAQYELRKGYVAQFQRPYNGIKAFTNKDLQEKPNVYDPIAAEYLRQYPERVIYFIRIPKVVKPVAKPVIAEVIKKTETASVVEPVVDDPVSIVDEVLGKPKPKRKPTKRSKKDD